MPRRPRIQVAGGTYYLLQLSNRHQPLFQEEADYHKLESLLAHSLQRSRTEALAYCWLPHELHLAVHSGEVSVSRFMQGFTSRYAHYVHQRSREIGHLFARRFQSLLIDPDTWLPALVRFIHYAPVRAGICATPQDHGYSSHAAYFGRAQIGWLHTATLFRILARGGLDIAAARSYLQSPPTVQEHALMSTNGRRHTRRLGEPTLPPTPTLSTRPARQRLTLPQLLDALALAQDVSRTDILSRSRRRPVSLARSLIAWHATERRIASLTQVAQFLGRDPSTLSKAIIRHRQRHPHLFRLDALSYLLPLA